MPLSRRDFLARTAGGAAGLLAVGDLTGLLKASPAFAAGGPGPLRPDPAALLDLAAGFSYTVLSRAGQPLTGGGVVPERFDGMGVFSAGGKALRLVRNHELGSSAALPVVADPQLTYDPRAKGGTTTVTVDRHSAVVDDRVSLAGTWSNCAGGVTPWGTWLTCEETEQKANGTTATRDHGFVFEVDPGDPAHNEVPTPLSALGRFAHEAVAVDPSTGRLYLTEDASNPNGLLYRCTPADATPTYGALRNGGTLHAMRCRLGSDHVPDLSVFDQPGTVLQVGWSAVPDPLAASTSTRKQLANSEVTRSRKLEGIWWDDADGRAHIVCSFARSSDGSLGQHDGQVWAYDPSDETLTLEVRFAVNTDVASDLPDGPDNITVSPYGGLFLCEDGDGASHVLAVDEDGRTHVFARNRLNDSEFAGACFSPDRKTLFLNIQDPGITFAVTGPFPRINRG
jgi:secreted PhoX family phosphatase